ncbi:MAG: hypothetical protein IPP15_23920 [Saprospiraceae bacterium]|uniref:Uncharacterized protein n=1 Tax=Candidatus Opimibacter skivensis TaxID=2982028 RepID=A0A9D7T047_9BACT|nr:hypothetical protein [Candidatus Opimibacter skivensis]
MKKLILFLFCLPSAISFSQKTSIWKGNSPGHPTDWHWAANWSTNALPDEFTDVIIPLDNGASINYPHIYKNDVEVNSLFMSLGANLVLDRHEIHILDLHKSYFLNDQIKHKVRLKGIEEFISDQPLNASR